MGSLRGIAASVTDSEGEGRSVLTGSQDEHDSWIREWTTDGCHPNPRGHREMADLILPVLKDVLGRR